MTNISGELKNLFWQVSTIWPGRATLEWRRRVSAKLGSKLWWRDIRETWHSQQTLNHHHHHNDNPITVPARSKAGRVAWRGMERRRRLEAFHDHPGHDPDHPLSPPHDHHDHDSNAGYGPISQGVLAMPFVPIVDGEFLPTGQTMMMMRRTMMTMMTMMKKTMMIFMISNGYGYATIIIFIGTDPLRMMETGNFKQTSLLLGACR